MARRTSAPGHGRARAWAVAVAAATAATAAAAAAGVDGPPDRMARAGGWGPAGHACSAPPAREAATAAGRGGPSDRGAQADLDVRVMLPLALRSAPLPTPPPPSASPLASSTPRSSPAATPVPASPMPTGPATATPAPPPSATPVPTDTPAGCGLPATFDAGRTPVAEVFVAPRGDDRSGDGSPARPFATIGRAARAAGPGTAIRLRPGVYAGGAFVENLRGTADAPIWIGGVPGDVRPVIEGGGEALHLVRSAYVVVHDLEVRRTTANGINADDGGVTTGPVEAHHLVFRGIEVAEVGGSGNQDCLKLSGVADVEVRDSAFRACGGGGSGSGIDIVGGHRIRIARSRFEAMSGNAVQAKGGSADVEVWANVMRDAGGRAVNMGGSTGFAYFRPPLDAAAVNAEARDIRVVANVIVGGDAPVAYVGCVGCLVAHNTLVDPGRWVARILQETTSRDGFTFAPASGGRFVNNVVSFQRARLSTFVNVGGGTAPETFTFAHNLWYASDAPARSQPSLPVPEVGGIVGRDPRLDAAFRPAPGSPARAAGVAVAGVRGDADGRCYADPPSIGAFEGP